MKLLLIAIFYSVSLSAAPIEYKDNLDTYIECPKFNSNEINIGSSDLGSFEYNAYNGYAVSKTTNNSKYFAHSNRVPYDSSNYIVWNVVPVGIGFLASKTSDGCASAEWKFNYTEADPYKVSPEFTGKLNSTHSSILKSEVRVNYKYHYFENPKPSIWDIAVKFSAVLTPLKKMRIGSFIEPTSKANGIFTQKERSESTSDKSRLKIFTTGLWLNYLFSEKISILAEYSLQFFDHNTYAADKEYEFKGDKIFTTNLNFGF